MLRVRRLLRLALKLAENFSLSFVLGLQQADRRSPVIWRLKNRHPDRDVGGLFSTPINPKTSKNITWGSDNSQHSPNPPRHTGIFLLR